MDDNKTDLNQTDDEKKSIGTVRYSSDEMADEDKTVSLFVNSRQKKPAPPEPVKEEVRQAAPEPVPPPVAPPIHNTQVVQQQPANKSTLNDFIASYKKRPLGTRVAIIAAPLIIIIVLIIALSGSNSGTDTGDAADTSSSISDTEAVSNGSFYDPETGFYFEFPTSLVMAAMPGGVSLVDETSGSAFFIYYMPIDEETAAASEEVASFQLENMKESLSDLLTYSDYMVGFESDGETVYTNATFTATDGTDEYVGTAEVGIMNGLMVSNTIVASADYVDATQEVWQGIYGSMTLK